MLLIGMVAAFVAGSKKYGLLFRAESAKEMGNAVVPVSQVAHSGQESDLAYTTPSQDGGDGTGEGGSGGSGMLLTNVVSYMVFPGAVQATAVATLERQLFDLARERDELLAKLNPPSEDVPRPEARRIIERGEG